MVISTELKELISETLPAYTEVKKAKMILDDLRVNIIPMFIKVIPYDYKNGSSGTKTGRDSEQKIADVELDLEISAK